MPTTASWQPLTPSDLGTVIAIAGQVHPGLPERASVFEEKIHLSAQTCFKLVQDGATVGYGLAHPWKLQAIPPLDDFLHGLPARPSCLYVHDIALLPAGRGRHASADLLDLLKAIARREQWPQLACVSVYGTSVYWRRFGFRPVELPSLAAKLKTYGDTACYMICDVG